MKIGVIGLGLIGGSIFKNLRSKDKYTVIGVSRTVIEENVSSDYNTLTDCDLVFVCTPMNITLDILDKLDSILPSKTIVTDVCSLKGFVSKKKYNFNFIPSHPMAGTEFSGWDNSFPEMFKSAKWIITPLGNNITDTQDTLEAVIEDMGAEVIITTPEEHDKAAALISHMPLVLAQALCENIKDNKLAQVMAASGFRDMTRLALSNTEMANDMVTLNKANIEASLDTLKDALDNILSSGYKDKAEQIKNFRDGLY